MGQALRRAAGRVRSATPPSSPQVKNVERRPTAATTNPEPLKDHLNEGIQRVQNDSVLEKRDPEYDAMLSKMVGRISTKPGGKLEMGEAFIVERYNRPMPRLRRTKAVDGDDGPKAPPPGTLDIAKLKEILLEHQGKASDEKGSMNARQIAEKYNVEVEYVEKILSYVSLPSEESGNKSNENT
ncbi:hypothetical protein H6P81_016129 [Aristolochia fimbriata]|uniref:Uncharacterized protein n=1 Tax=Aristolochia fimbriata TaxID=158543 RepID=A0AAV7E965_ARIFI|nr:hypothetical protein H6P81_016129 [Aristolochia fimbriata]